MTRAGRAARRHGPARAALPLLLAAPLALACPAPATAGPTAAAATTTASSLAGTSVHLLSLTPTSVAPGALVQATVRVTNSTAAPLAGARVRMFVDSPALTSRAAVASWAAGEGVRSGDRFAGVDGAEHALSAAVPAGGSTDVTITVPADQLRLGSAWGARGVTLDVLDAGLRRLGDVRTFLVWAPAGAAVPTAPLAVLSPVVAGAPDVATGRLREEEVAPLTSPGGRLSDLLEATGGPASTLVVDPALLGPFTTGAGAAAGATATAAPAPTASADANGLAAWLGDLRGRLATAPAGTAPAVASLPEADPDVGALAQSGTGELAQLAAAQGSARLAQWLATGAARAPSEPAPTSSTTSPSPSSSGGATSSLAPTPTATPAPATGAPAATGAPGGTPVPAGTSAEATPTATSTGATAPPAGAGLLWPADGSAGPAVLALARSAAPAGGAAPAVVVSSASLPAAPGTAGARPATTALTGGGASAVGVVVDRDDSGVLVDGTAAGSTTGAQASARLLADAAVAAGAGGALVLATPRAWDPDPALAAGVLATVASAPWVRPTPLADLLAAPPATSTAVAAGTADPAALPGDGLRAAADAVRGAQQAASLVPNPAALLAPLQASAVAAASTSWRGRTATWREGVTGILTRAAAQADAVQVVASNQPVTAISSNVNLPVTVRNALNQPATVTVSLRSLSFRLRAQGSRTITVPPGAQQAVSLPVRALASGDIRLAVLLTSADGRLVGEPAGLQVRVRADWEGRGVLAAGAVAVLVIVAGLVRTARRVRRRPPPPVVRSAEVAAGARGPERGDDQQDQQDQQDHQDQQDGERHDEEQAGEHTDQHADQQERSRG